MSDDETENADNLQAPYADQLEQQAPATLTGENALYGQHTADPSQADEADRIEQSIEEDGDDEDYRPASLPDPPDSARARTAA